MTPIWTIRNLISWTIPWFDNHGVQSSRLDAELLLAHALDCRRLDLYLNPDKPVTEAERTRFKSLIRRRAAREPVAYIISEKEFYGRIFHVDRRVLIPRPETEALIETALKYASDRSVPHIVDLGTGSGCIAVTLALEIPDTHLLAVDQSRDAIAVAIENSTRHDVADRILFREGNWFEPLTDLAAPKTIDLVVSNPPYIRHDELQKLQPEITRYEPRLALDGGSDGLQPYLQIASGAKYWLKSGGCLILEIGHDQGDAVRQILANTEFGTISIFKDLAGLDRVIWAVNG